MNLRDKKDLIIEYCRKLYDKGYVPGVDGNISMRVDEETILITPSGIGKDLVTQADLVLVDLCANVVSGSNKPSIETPMHIAAFKESHDTNAVIHMHSTYTTAFALARHVIDTRYAPFARFHLGDVGYVSYSTPGEKRLHDEVSGCIKKGHKVLLLESHGAMVLACDMKSAFAKADLLEYYAKMLIAAKSLGGAQMLSEDDLHDLHGG